MPKDREELLLDLWEQVDFIEWSHEGFDNGRLNEAKRLSVHLRILLHHTGSAGGKSHSVIHQLGLEKSLKWIDHIGPIDPKNKASKMPPIQISNTFIGFKPPPMMIYNGPMLDFDEWWLSPAIKWRLNPEDEDSSKMLSRKQVIVTILANKMGGAHVDPDGHPDYYAIVRDRAHGYRYREGDGEFKPLDSNAIFACARQISGEVVESLKRQSELIK
jgi:hypothetical protein